MEYGPVEWRKLPDCLYRRPRAESVLHPLTSWTVTPLWRTEIDVDHSNGTEPFLIDTDDAESALRSPVRFPEFSMLSATQKFAVLRGAACCCTFGFLLSTASAQSATRSAVPMRSSSAAPLGVTASAPVGLQGYCPVCVIEMKKWIRGNSSIRAQHDGKTYFFPGEEQRQMFLANPAKYTPALRGDCAVCLTDMKKKMPGSVHFSALHENRLFLFPNAEIKQKFMASPAKYANADLALNGNCPVCRVEMKQEIAGKPEFATTYGGMRYLFPSAKQRSMFVANPGKYAVRQAGVAAGNATRTPNLISD